MIWFLVLQILFLFVLPVILIKYNLISIKSRLYFLFLLPIIIIIDIVYNNWSLTQIGFRFDNLSTGFMPYLVLASIGALILLIFSKILGRDIDKNILTKDSHFIYLMFIPISILQQFIFQGYLLNKLLLTQLDPFLSILIVASLFAFMHFIYPNAFLHVPLAFLGGILFAQTYYYYPNIYLASIMHLILNPIAVLHGFFVPLKHHKNVYEDLINSSLLIKHIKKNFHLIKIYFVLLLFVSSYFLYKNYFNIDLIIQNVEIIKLFIINHSILSPILFILSCIILINSPLSITAILKIGAGFFFGFFFGFFYSLIGFFIASVIGYLLSKYLFHNYLYKKESRFVKKVNQEIKKNGFYYFLSLRMILIIPHYIINIVGGLSKIKLSSFSLSTILGLIPETIVYVYLGSLLTNLTKINNVLDFDFIIILSLFAIISLIPSLIKLYQSKLFSNKLGIKD